MVESGFESCQCISKVHDLMPHMTAACHHRTLPTCVPVKDLFVMHQNTFCLFSGDLFALECMPPILCTLKSSSPGCCQPGALPGYSPWTSHGILYRGDLRAVNYLSIIVYLTLHSEPPI